MRPANATMLTFMFVVVVVCLVLLGAGVGGEWATVVLACGVILVSSAIAAMVTAARQSRQGKRRRPERQYVALAVVAGLLVTSVGAMVALVVVTGPVELVKTALGAVIVLAGSGVSAVLAMTRADAAGRKADAAGERAEAARVAADGADRRASEARDEARRSAGGTTGGGSE